MSGILHAGQRTHDQQGRARQAQGVRFPEGPGHMPAHSSSDEEKLLVEAVARGGELCREVPGRAPRAAARFGDVEARTHAELGRPLAALVDGSEGGLWLAVQHWSFHTGVG